MARRPGQLIRAFAIALLLPCAALCLHGAPTPSPTPSTPPPSPAPSVSPGPSPVARPSASPAPKSKQPKGDEWNDARRVFEQLSKDQQKKFLDNLNQWKGMSPDEQEMFRDLELFRREKIAQEIQGAINRTGLHLDDDQREVYALRYTQERRKIEQALRKEMDQKRQQMVTEMLGRLKLEFGSQPPGAKSTPPEH